MILKTVLLERDKGKRLSSLMKITTLFAISVINCPEFPENGL